MSVELLLLSDPCQAVTCEEHGTDLISFDAPVAGEYYLVAETVEGIELVDIQLLVSCP